MTDPAPATKPTINDRPILSCDNLGKINQGYFGAAVDLELKRIIADCDAKPNLDKPRRLTIVVDVSPLAHQSSEGAYGLVVTGAVSSKLPAFKADPSVLDIKRKADKRNGGEVLTAHFTGPEPTLFDGSGE